MLYPARNTAIGFIPYRFVGGAPSLSAGVAVNRRGMFTKMSKTTAVPDGYSKGLVMPYIAGGMSSWQAQIEATGAGVMIAGGPMAGNGDMAFSSGGSVALIIAMTGNGSIAISGAGGLALTIALAGDGSLAVTGAGGLSMIIPMVGVGAFGLDGAGDMRGLLSMEGSWTPFTELSPENLAVAVWTAAAAANNTTGTMGEKLNDAGGAANPWNEVIESGLTAAEVLRLVASALAGKVSGGGGSTITFRDLGDTKDRLIATVDTFGNRTAIVRDAN